ncbi:MAG: radical SAM family heme chaperone HemW [Thermoanaerobaculia bacterium]|nr:radical SAM family heme chaperone HemW [Thermoanaerobaculia bacterium]
MPRNDSPPEKSLSVYIHLPFCRVKCTYCAFAISTDLRLEDRYVEAIIEEIRLRVPTGARIESLYFGGGTPSRLAPRSVARLGEALGALQRPSNAEVTFEANPEDVDLESVSRWIELLGVNRLSVGAQSFHEEELRPLGRQHGRSGAVDAIELATSLVPRVSVDLILGLPHQTPESVRSSAEIALSMPVGHVSLYLLDLEPGSALEGRVRGGLVDLPDDDVTAEMYREVVRATGRAGLEQYEVSNFARPGEEAIHNRRYWERKPYLGVGIGAHSFDGRQRSGNVRSISDYLEAIESRGSAVDFEEVLTDEEIRHERLFLGMRQTAGLPLEELMSLGGDGARSWLDEGVEQGWIELDDGTVRFTIEGFLVSDELLARLF